MRTARALLGVLCLFALPLAGADAAPPRGAVVLAGKGLVVRGATLRFGTPRSLAMKMVTAALGPATAIGVDPECGGDHPIGSAKFRGGLELAFVGGRLVGWTLDSGNARTANGVGIGITVRTLRRLIPGVVVDKGNEDGGGIGPGFNSETSVNGWLDGIAPTSKILSLYAGETCIVE